MEYTERIIKGGYVAELMVDTMAPDPRVEFLTPPGTDSDAANYDEIVEMWAGGGVYEYQIIDATTGEVVQSLCGMYGYDYSYDAMTDALDELTK